MYAISYNGFKYDSYISVTNSNRSTHKKNLFHFLYVHIQTHTLIYVILHPLLIHMSKKIAKPGSLQSAYAH